MEIKDLGMVEPPRKATGPDSGDGTLAVAAMVVGQAIFMGTTQPRASGFAWRVSKKTGAKFVTRKVDGGTNIYRIS